MVLAVIVGIGSTMFGQFTSGFNNPPTIDDALTLILAALALLGLSIFGVGVANGLIAGGPQLGAGAAIGTGLAAGGGVVAAGAATAGAIGVAGRAIGGAAGIGASAAGGATAAFRAGGARGVAGAAGNVATSPLRRAATALQDRYEGGARSAMSGAADRAESGGATSASSPPAWVNRMRRHQAMHRGASAAHHAVRSGDHPSGGSSVDLSEGS
jgi:type IV secretion system protein TrbL